MKPPSATTLRRIHSLSGLVALGAYLLLHLGFNAAAIRGQGAFIAATAPTRGRFVWIAEILFVGVPFAFHALYGFWSWRRPRPDQGRFPTDASWVHGAQRISGLVLFVFVLAHVWELRAQRAVHGLAHDALYSTMVLHLSSTTHGVPLMAIAYLLGVSAAVFHLSAGLWTYVVSHTPLKGQRLARAGWACAAFGLLLFIVGSGTVVSLATGMHLGRGEAGSEATCVPAAR